MNAPLPANLDREIACAWNDGSPRLTDLLAERARREEAAESIDARCFRLGLKAADHDKCAEDFDAEAAQDDLVVKVRRERFGNDDSAAANIAARAAAGRRCAADERAEADRLRSQAASLRKAQSFADTVARDLAERIG